MLLIIAERLTMRVYPVYICVCVYITLWVSSLSLSRLIEAPVREETAAYLCEARQLSGGRGLISAYEERSGKSIYTF